MQRSARSQRAALQAANTSANSSTFNSPAFNYDVAHSQESSGKNIFHQTDSCVGVLLPRLEATVAGSEWRQSSDSEHQEVARDSWMAPTPLARAGLALCSHVPREQAGWQRLVWWSWDPAIEIQVGEGGAAAAPLACPTTSRAAASMDGSRCSPCHQPVRLPIALPDSTSPSPPRWGPQNPCGCLRGGNHCVHTTVAWN